MINLLEETIKTMEAFGKCGSDVVCVISYIRNEKDGTRKMSWDSFKKISDIRYDNGFGSSEINSSLSIIGKDWWMERYEYDGSEWWECKMLPCADEIKECEQLNTKKFIFDKGLN